MTKLTSNMTQKDFMQPSDQTKSAIICKTLGANIFQEITQYVEARISKIWVKGFARVLDGSENNTFNTQKKGNQSSIPESLQSRKSHCRRYLFLYFCPGPKKEQCCIQNFPE